jgi:signal transduction histidine kinase/CheY-like chemotaxis protein
MHFNAIELTYNLSVLVALSVVSGFIKQCECDRAKKDVLQGVLFGTAVIIAMNRPVGITTGISFDGHSVMLCLCALFFGPLPALIASAMAIVTRILMGGSPHGVVVGVLIIISASLWGTFFHFRWPRKGLPLTAIRLWHFGIIVHVFVVAMMLGLPESHLAVGIPVLAIYPLATLLIGKILSGQDEAIAAVAALRISETHSKDLMENLPVGVVVHDVDSGVVFANPTACKLLGVTLGEMTGKKAEDQAWHLVREDGTPLPLVEYPVNRVAATGHGIQNQVVGITHTGNPTTTWVLCNAYHSTSKLDPLSPAKIQITVVFVDITDHIQAERDKERLQTQLMRSQRMESLGSLAGGIAHDMNNVLAAIRGMAEVGRDDQEEGSRSWKSFDTIIKAAGRGGITVKSLLTFARQRSEDAVTTEIVDLNMVLKDEVALLERTTLARVKLVLALEEHLWPIYGDVSALNLMFMNLCINSMDAMPDGGTITLRTRNSGHGYIEVIVEDTGQGMSKEVLDRALDPFFTTKEVGKGTGLGLPMVFTTVKAHKGIMEIKSEVGVGTKVILRFPSCKVDPPKDRAIPPGEDHTHGSLTIFVIDDDDLIQNATAAVLESLGHKVSVSSTGEEALERLKTGFKPDVVILDMNMPGMGGMAALPLIREILPATPILITTGWVNPEALALVDRYPLVTTLTKPYTISDLKQYLSPFVQKAG